MKLLLKDANETDETCIKKWQMKQILALKDANATDKTCINRY